jgi:hypothetical protein
MPITKQPATLTANVANGKNDEIWLANKIDTKYRATLPINPPMPTKRIFLSIVICNFEQESSACEKRFGSGRRHFL